MERLAQRATLRHQSLARLLRDRRLQNFDAIGVFLTGSKLNDIRLALQRNRQRPLLFCGFNGVVLDHFIEGVSWRLGYDLICLSGPRDQDALEPSWWPEPRLSSSAPCSPVCGATPPAGPGPVVPAAAATGVCRAGDHAGIDHRASPARAAAQRSGPPLSQLGGADQTPDRARRRHLP